MLKKFLFKRISSILIPKSSKLHRYVKKVRKLYNTRYKCNHKHDPKIFYLIKVTVPKKTSLLSLSSRLYHVIMKLKCKARRYLSLFSCNSESHYFSFQLSTDVEKNPGPTQSNTDSHETIIKHASLNVGYQGKSGPGKIHEVILVLKENIKVPWTIIRVKRRDDFTTSKFTLRDIVLAASPNTDIAGEN